jgi:hypothetical protein
MWPVRLASPVARSAQVASMRAARWRRRDGRCSPALSCCARSERGEKRAGPTSHRLCRQKEVKHTFRTHLLAAVHTSPGCRGYRWMTRERSCREDLGGDLRLQAEGCDRQTTAWEYAWLGCRERPRSHRARRQLHVRADGEARIQTHVLVRVHTLTHTHTHMHTHTHTHTHTHAHTHAHTHTHARTHTHAPDWGMTRPRWCT